MHINTFYPQTYPVLKGKVVINDFNIHVATVNGSGSQSTNMVLMRSIFQMGVPVSGKSIFPSNIVGLPRMVHNPGQQKWIYRPEGRN